MASKFSPQQCASPRPKHTYTCHDDGRHLDAPAAARCTNKQGGGTRRGKHATPERSAAGKQLPPPAHRASAVPPTRRGEQRRKPQETAAAEGDTAWQGRQGRRRNGRLSTQCGAEVEGAHKVATRAATGHPIPVPSYHQGGRRGRAHGAPPPHTHPHRPVTRPPPHPPTRQGAPPPDRGKHTGRATSREAPAASPRRPTCRPRWRRRPSDPPRPTSESTAVQSRAQEKVTPGRPTACPPRVRKGVRATS